VLNPYESNFLAPDATFFVGLLALVLLFSVIVVWPLVETVVRRQWGWTLGVLLLGPIGGLLWFTTGRRQTRTAVPSH